MRERCVRVEHGLPLVADIVGTGGDGAGTINISTAAALVVAGCGIPVAKHGNRAATSKCGSADVLEALGVEIERDPEVSARLLRESCIAFLFARRHHPATRAVGPVRSELGVRTIFNVLGPLTNPAGANRQVVGVAEERHLMLLAEALRDLGGEAAAVVHSASGLDEIAGEGPTYVMQFDGEGHAPLAACSTRPTTACTRRSMRFRRRRRGAVNAEALTPPRSWPASVRRARIWSVAQRCLSSRGRGRRGRYPRRNGTRARRHCKRCGPRSARRPARRAYQGGRLVNDMLDKLYAATAARCEPRMKRASRSTCCGPAP